jgi:alkyl sulfatase BDS1-like metallo-beta-lactamase superfamily hydrolase
MQRAALPFDDERDLAEAKRGFLAEPAYSQIMAEAGHVAWDFTAYDFLGTGEQFDSIHPSLQRQATLNAEHGLFEVVPGHVYQVRGFDLANISFIRSETGWIVFDPLTCKETAAAALALANQHLGERPVVAVVFSHSHGDHFGGVRGVVDEADVRAGRVPIIAPVGFMEHAVAENVYAGNAMNRRMYYQYGSLLDRSPFGHVDQAIGKGVAAGTSGLIAPTVTISGEIEELTVDGVPMVFQNTPGTEAPAEMNTWFPDLKAFWAAENIVATIHNIYTLRGALIRDSLEWSRQINRALYLFGREAEVMFASHSWPRWGNDRIQEVMRAQRDTYAHLNNGVLHLANQGVTVNQIHNVYEVPEPLQRQWSARSYHGSVAHNARGVVNRYLGYWDANPATLIPLSPQDSAPLKVELMGGAEPILARGRTLMDQGQYLLAIEILNLLVLAEPGNEGARHLLADAFEQVGYQQESPSVRNSFLAGALELRSGIPTGVAPSSTGPDLIRALSTGQFLDFLGIRLDPAKALGLEFTANLITPDNDEHHVIELRNGTLTNLRGFLAEDADVTLTIDRADLEEAMTGAAPLARQVAEGRARIDGDAGLLVALAGMLVHFEPGFEILPGTGGPSPAGELDDFAQDPLADSAGG